LTIVEALKAIEMDEKRAIAALGALAQETRLARFDYWSRPGRRVCGPV